VEYPGLGARQAQGGMITIGRPGMVIIHARCLPRPSPGYSTGGSPPSLFRGPVDQALCQVPLNKSGNRVSTSKRIGQAVGAGPAGEAAVADACSNLARYFLRKTATLSDGKAPTLSQYLMRSGLSRTRSSVFLIVDRRCRVLRGCGHRAVAANRWPRSGKNDGVCVPASSCEYEQPQWSLSTLG